MGYPYYPHAQPPKPSGGLGIVVIVIVVIVGTGILIVGVLAVLAMAGTRKYVATAKTAEAHTTLREIALDAQVAYESGTPGVYALCPSAAAPVPKSLTDVAARKYMSSPSDWSDGAGFQCMHFSMTSPQYYQYNYTAFGGGAVGDTFTAEAHGDLNGDGIPSSFMLRGRVNSPGSITVDTTVLEVDPNE